MNGFVAASQLAQRASENGFMIEYVCLAASVIDASLRMGLILQHQLKTRSSEILEDLLLQDEGDPITSEREIYRRAYREEVVDQNLFQKLEALYVKRNRVLHRYIISDLSTLGVLEIAAEFEQIIPAVTTAVGVLEARQEELGVGMSKSGELPGLGRRLGDMSAEKHGHPSLARALEKGGT